MRKPSLLYASPFPPQKSGISDYSHFLVKGLRRYFDITLLIHDCEIDARQYSSYRIRRYHELSEWDRFDYKLYNIGNNPHFHAYIYEACLRHPGTVILHETVLYYLFTGYYQTRESFYQQVYELEGARGVATLRGFRKSGVPLLQFPEPETLPLNRELIRSGNRFIVHSEYASRVVRDVADSPVDVRKINHLIVDPPPVRRNTALLKRHGIPADAIVIGSFGFIAPTKLNHVVCEAVRQVNRGVVGRPVHYLMVGEGEYVDRYCDSTIHKTGFVPESEFFEYLGCVDLVMNLRHPSMGETSGALLRALSCGKPAVVCNDGWFAELPNDTVLKVSATPAEVLRWTLPEIIKMYATNPVEFLRMGVRAQQHLRTAFHVDVVSQQMSLFLQNNDNATATGTAAYQPESVQASLS